MKKILVTIVMLLLAVMCFTACNKTVIDVNYKFTKAYICVGDEWIDVDVDKWNDYEGEQIQLKLKDGTVLIVHSSDCILYNGTLPKGE